MAGFISPILGAAMQGWGLQQQMHQQKWLEDFAINELNNRRANQQFGQDRWMSLFDPARDRSMQLMDWFSPALFGEGGSQEQLISQMSKFPGLLEQYTGNPYQAGMSGEMESLLGQIGERRGAYGNLADTAMQGFQGGGWTQARQDSQERLMDLLNGMGSEMGELSASGLDLLSHRGQNPFTQGMQDRGLEAANAGGWTDPLEQAQQYGLGILQQGGQTDVTRGLSARGLDLAGREALLPDEMIFNAAREDAANTAQDAFMKAQRTALARGGGSGSIAAAGGAEYDPMSEWADQASQSVAGAGREALAKQQALKLQQMQQGSQMALGANDQATNRILSSLGLFPQLQNSATNYAGTMGGLGVNAGQLEMSRMGAGQNALNTLLQSRLGAGGLMNTSMADQGQYALGLGNLGMNAENAFGGATQGMFDRYLGAGQFGANLNQQNFGMNNQYFNNLLGLNRDNMTNYMGGLNSMLNLGGQGLTWGTGGMGSTAPPQYINTQPAFSSIAQGLSGMIPSGGGGNKTKLPMGGSGIPGYPN